jgi:DNA-binding SARP family transcriptional activator
MLEPERATADAMIEHSIALLSEPEIPFAKARVQLLWGERLIGLGDEVGAGPHLDEALAAFERLGAQPWSARCARAIGDGSVVADPAPALTVDERRVAQDVAAGRSVADVATALFRSPQSVERALASAMDKVGAATPEGLRSALRTPTMPVTIPVEITLLGDFRVRRGDLDLTPPPGMGARALKVVALAEGSLHVDELVETLWPDAEPGRGRTRLRNVLARLRGTSGDLIERRGDVVALLEAVEVDVVAFRHAAAHAFAVGDAAGADAHTRLALAHYGGDLLPDSVYEPWATAARERLRRDHLALLDNLGSHLLREGDIDGATRVLEDAIAADRYDEDRYVRLGEALVDAGRRGAAAGLARRARAALAELDVEPSPALRAIEAAVRMRQLPG